MIANQAGGYDMRRWLQVFMLLLLAVGLLLLVRWSVRHKAWGGIWACCAPELIGLVYLCGLFVLRAVSLHGAGALLSAEVIGLRVNWIAELAGIHALNLVFIIRMLARTSPRG